MRAKAGNTVNDTGDTLEIHIYKGEKENSFVMYEDDGETFSYQQGNCNKRKLTYNPHRFTFGKSEGSFTSPYKTIEVYFHGFHNLKNVQVNQSAHALHHKDYRFLQPMANYDPVGTQHEGPIIRELPYISIPHDSTEIVLSW